MHSKRLLRQILLSSCGFSAAAILLASPAAAANVAVTSGTQSASAPITGTDTLTKTGTGTYTLTAANSSTGTTTISAGTLQIGTTVPGTSYDTTAAIASNSIVNSGTLVFNRGDGNNSAAPSYTYAGVISGAGAVKQIGYGTLIVTGNNTYTGVTTLTTTTVSSTNYGAILQLGNGGTTGWIGSTSIVNGANSTVIFNRSDDVTWAGVISSSGAVTQAGPGALTFTGANTYTGATTISAGSLVLKGTGSVGAASAVTNNGIFDFSGITATSLTIKSLAGTATTASVIAGAKNLTLTSGATYAGAISGTGTLTITGGTEIFTADNPNFTGPIVLNGGTLQYGNSTIAGSLSTMAAPIANNGTFAFARGDAIVYTGVISGTGALKQNGPAVLTLNAVNTYTGLTTVSGGTLAVGDASHTTAKIGGAASVLSGATLTGYGTIAGAVSNAGTVRAGNGSVGNLTVGGTYTQTGTFISEISSSSASALNATGAATLGGTFAVVAEPGSYGNAAYTAPVLTAASITGTFANASGVSGDVLYAVSYGAKEVDAVIVPKVVGQVYGDVITQTLENTNVLNDIALDHAAFDRCNDAKAACRGWSVWEQNYYGVNHVDATNGADAFNGHSWGVIGGLGYTFSNEASLNLAVAYSSHKLGVNSARSFADTDGVFTALTFHMGGPVLGIDLNGFYLSNKSDISRDTNLGAVATSKLNSTGGGFTAQVTVPLLGGDVTPLAKAVYTFVSYGPLTETGAPGLNLEVDHGRQTTGYYDAGVRLSHVFAMNGYSLKPHLYAGAQLNGTEGVPAISASLADWANTAFTAPSATPEKYSGVVRAGLEAKFSDAFTAQADFNGKFGTKQQQAYFTLGASYRF